MAAGRRASPAYLRHVPGGNNHGAAQQLLEHRRISTRVTPGGDHQDQDQDQQTHTRELRPQPAYRSLPEPGGACFHDVTPGVPKQTRQSTKNWYDLRMAKFPAYNRLRVIPVVGSLQIVFGLALPGPANAESHDGKPKMVDLWSPGDSGQRMRIRGRVTGIDGRPLRYHADSALSRAPGPRLAYRSNSSSAPSGFSTLDFEDILPASTWLTRRQ